MAREITRLPPCDPSNSTFAALNTTTMKLTQMFTYGLLATTLLFGACNSNTPTTTGKAADSTTAAPAPKQAPTSDLGQEQTGNLMQMLASYYELKDALVASDAAKADAATSHLTTTAEAFKNSVSSLPAYKDMSAQVDHILKASDSLLASKGENIETQRSFFSGISDALFSVLQTSKLQNGGVYWEHCPMAFDDKGANWLSMEREIKNPYFGHKMMECGAVMDSL